jgi:hypothetical protein
LVLDIIDTPYYYDDFFLEYGKKTTKGVAYGIQNSKGNYSGCFDKNTGNYRKENHYSDYVKCIDFSTRVYDFHTSHRS